MRMSGLERRLQILLDQERYDRLDREARESGRSVASLVREAIDLRNASAHTRRAEAGRRLLTEFTDRDLDEPDWAATKADLGRELDSRLP